MRTLSILVYGADSDLLHTRGLVLGSKGYRVTPAFSRARAETALDGGGSFDLLLICHSIPQEECLRWVREAYVRWPTLKVLILASLTPFPIPELEAKTVFSSFGPAPMLRAIADIFNAPQAS